MTSRIRFVVETVENRGKTVWLVGVNRKETVHGSFTGRSNSMAAPFRVDVGPSGLSLGIRIAIPSATKRLLWPAHKFQDFLRLSRVNDHYFTTSLLENPKSPQFPREKLEHYERQRRKKSRKIGAQVVKSRDEVENKVLKSRKEDEARARAPADIRLLSK